MIPDKHCLQDTTRQILIWAHGNHDNMIKICTSSNWTNYQQWEGEGDSLIAHCLRQCEHKRKKPPTKVANCPLIKTIQGDFFFCWNGDCMYMAQGAGNFIGQKSNKLWVWMIPSASHFPCSLKVINTTEVGVLSFLSDTSRILIAYSCYQCVNCPVCSFSSYLGFLAH